MDFCTTDTDNSMLHSPTSLRLEDLITAPAKAEFLLELLTPDQILAIEQTLGKVKKRRLNKSAKIAQDNNVTATTPSNPLTSTSTPATTPTLKQSNNNSNNNATSTPNEPVTEMRDGVEWVSFVYSHNRTLKRYSIRTDLQQIDISVVDDKFKSENCVSIHCWGEDSLHNIDAFFWHRFTLELICPKKNIMVIDGHTKLNVMFLAGN